MDNPPTDQKIVYEDEAPKPEPPAEPEEKEPPAQPTVVGTGLPDPKVTGAPPWVRLPDGLRFPRYRTAMFLRFPSAWTHAPNAGLPLLAEDPTALKCAPPGAKWRQVICWPCSIGDQKLAIGRSMQDPNRYTDELAKQMIRAIDGVVVDHSGLPGTGNVDIFWDQLGSCRRLVMQIYNQLHSLSREQLTLFFESCIELRNMD